MGGGGSTLKPGLEIGTIIGLFDAKYIGFDKIIYLYNHYMYALLKSVLIVPLVEVVLSVVGFSELTKAR